MLLIEPEVALDERGFFFESWNAERFKALGLDTPFVQDNHSRSAKNVLRGLHYQLPGSQAKLVRVSAGRIEALLRARVLYEHRRRREATGETFV